MTELLDKTLPAHAGEEDVSQFLQEVRSFPRLTVQQERELARRCAQGDEGAIREMVNANLRLVVSIAREYAGRGVPLLDLIQEGSIGLLAAARKFDYTRQLRFSTYATKWIRKGVTACLWRYSGLIRVPAYTAERIRKVASARAALLQETGRAPTPGQIARHSGMEESKVLELMRLSPEVFSLDLPTGDGEDDTLHTLLEDVQVPQPYAGLVRLELEKTVRQLLEVLTPRQQQVLRLHYGMEDGTCYSLEEIGRRLGISKERTRQIEKQAMDQLLRSSASMGLEEYLNE